MKKLLSLALLMTAGGAAAYTQDLSGLKAGSVLTYDVKSGGTAYEFIVTIKSFDKDKAPEFEWKMTEPVNRNGSVKITAEAIASSYAWFNYFSGGATTLDKETSVFVSSQLKDDIAAAEKGAGLKQELQVNGASRTGENFFVRSKKEAFSYASGGENQAQMDCIRICNEDDTKCATISTAPVHGIILSMRIGFVISLREVKF